MSGTETLTVRAADVRLGDQWHDDEEDLDVRCIDTARAVPWSSRPDTIRLYAQAKEENIKGFHRLRLLYGTDEMLTVTRALPPTDEEHEARLRLLVLGDGSLDSEAVTRTAVAALLRLLDAERAKVAGVEAAFRQQDEGLTGQGTALSYARSALGRKS